MKLKKLVSMLFRLQHMKKSDALGISELLFNFSVSVSELTNYTELDDFLKDYPDYREHFGRDVLEDEHSSFLLAYLINREIVSGLCNLNVSLQSQYGISVV